MSSRINPALVLLLVGCIFNHVLYPSEVIEVLPLISCAIVTGLIYYTESMAIKRFSFLLYVGLSCFMPSYIAFVPIVLFAFYLTENRVFALLSILPFTLHFLMLIEIQNNLYVSLLLTVLAFFIKNQQLEHMQLKLKLTEKSDAMRELTMNLNEKNRLLVAHQDDAVLYATLSERNRIAREIHDHVGHQLSRVLLQIGAQLTLKPLDPALLSMKESLDAAMDNLRNSVHDLHDTSINIEFELKQLCDQFENCPVYFHTHLDVMPPAKVKYALIAILKEGLSNISKHSNATQANVSLVEHPSFYQFIISDNGDALMNTTVTTPYKEHGIGLQNIEQRVSEHSGRFHIRTQKGFELFITIPK